MRYWDASALVALCVEEGTTDSMRTLARATRIVTWGLSQVEVASAIERRTREGALGEAQREIALQGLSTLARAWTEVTALTTVRDHALHVLARHPLRAADAMQLAAALVASSERPAGHEFVCSDERLRAAARREGFRILP